MPIRKFNKQTFILAIENSQSIRQVLVKLNLAPKGGNYKCFYRAAKTFGVDVSHIGRGKSTIGVTKHRSQITDQEIIYQCAIEQSLASVLRSLCLTTKSGSGTSYAWIKNKIKELGISTSHFTGQGHLRGKTHNWSVKIPLFDIMVENSLCQNNNALKKRLIRENILIEKCNECEISHWQDKKLSLHMDHINGINDDNRLENLRLLCPNCHSLTPTYCGKNKGLK